jgi:hypothetical protein
MKIEHKDAMPWKVGFRYQCPVCGDWHLFTGSFASDNASRHVDSCKRRAAATSYLAEIGSKGGKATGKSKVRGDADYYKRISQKAAEARKRKAAELDRLRRELAEARELLKPCECCGAPLVKVEAGRATCWQGCSYPAETT